ncbi:MAG: ribosome small subunit-dependent GTPase A [Ignavibacterium sp.]|nr:ribosome small subunit-dependent GTPase A [Ignavibacterium sp.]
MVGDLVEYEMNKDGSGVIKKILTRKNYLSRKAPRIKGASYRGERLEQVIAANIDNVFIVASVSEPEFNHKSIDRFLVACESSNLKTHIIINKTDLIDDDSYNLWKELYASIGYDVIMSSTITGEGIEEIQDLIAEKKNLFWGHSGVGKSSILNKLFPELNLKVGEISSYSQKGIHTTVTSTMFFIGNNTYIVDTPGIREIDPYGIREEDLSHYFIEFNQFNDNCRFNTCTHHHEPGCAIIDAVENEKISMERYDSYLRILDSIEEDLNF